VKLLLVTTVFPSPLQPEKGAFNHEMVRSFGSSHAVQVIAPIPWPVVWRAWRQGVSWDTARRFGNVDVRHPVYGYTPYALRSCYGGFFRWSIRRAVDESLRDYSPDVVAGYWAHPDGYAALAIARRLGVPCVIMVGGSDVLLLGQQPRRGRLIREVLQGADAIVTVSEDLRQAVLRWSVPADKVHVVCRGVDLARFTPGNRDEARQRLGIAPRDPMLLWVGHMVPVKGLDLLLEACAIAAAKTPFHLYLVGDGPLRAELQRRCSVLSIADRVSFAGAVSHASLPDWYRAADWTVLSSRSEGIPNVLLESAACGTPFIAPRVGGIPEVADLLVDRIVPPNDPAALAEAICRSVTTISRLERRRTPPSLEAASHRLLAVLASTIAGARRGEDAAGSVGAVRSVEAQS
jgi:glycosyltransferase involved in cell wall biosynthesis